MISSKGIGLKINMVRIVKAVTLQRYEKKERSNAYHSRQSDFIPHEVRHNTCLDGTNPEVMKEKNCHIKSVHVI
jgi:hypothetical protein